MSRERETALEVERMGYQPVVLAPNSKIPQLGYPLAEHFRRNVRVEEISGWFDRNVSLGIVTGGGVAAIDFDDKEKGREFYKRFKGILKTITETRDGVHFYCQASNDLATQTFEDGDFKAKGGYVVIPHSTVIHKDDGSRWTYRFVEGHGLVPPDELPVFDPDMIGLKVSTTDNKMGLTRDEVRHAIHYVMEIESIDDGSSNKSEASRGLVRACSILRDAGLPEAEAMVVMIDWNNSGKAVPPWPLRELARALTNTYRKKI